MLSSFWPRKNCVAPCMAANVNAIFAPFLIEKCESSGGWRYGWIAEWGKKRKLFMFCSVHNTRTVRICNRHRTHTQTHMGYRCRELTLWMGGKLPVFRAYRREEQRKKGRANFNLNDKDRERDRHRNQRQLECTPIRIEIYCTVFSSFLHKKLYFFRTNFFCS